MHDAILCDAKEEALFGFKEGDGPNGPGEDGGKVVRFLDIDEQAMVP
jgi:hypothetical protein